MPTQPHKCLYYCLIDFLYVCNNATKQTNRKTCNPSLQFTKIAAIASIHNQTNAQQLNAHINEPPKYTFVYIQVRLLHVNIREYISHCVKLTPKIRLDMHKLICINETFSNKIVKHYVEITYPHCMTITTRLAPRQMYRRVRREYNSKTRL